MNNKGIYFVGMAIITGLLVGFALFAFYSSEQNNNYAAFGTEQKEVLASYALGEKALFYIDTSTQYVSKEHVFLKKDVGCGFYKEIVLWKYGSKECFPDYVRIYNLSFNEALEPYFLRFSDLKIPTYNHNIQVFPGMIQGDAIEPLTIDKGNIHYEIIPNFRIKSEFSLAPYSEVREKAEEILSICKDDLNCWKSNLPSSWDIEQEGKVFMFSVLLNQEKMQFAFNFNPLVS